MATVGADVRCPSCGAAASARFCGRCGALVQPRARAPGAPDADRVPVLAAPPDAGDGPPARPGGDAGARVPWRRAGAGLAGLLTAIVAVGLLLRSPAEVVTANGLAGADGSGRTSTRAVAELTPRWDVAWNGSPVQAAGLTGLHHLPDLLLLTTDSELIALRHPAALPDRRGRGLQRPVDPVLWRSPAVAGTPHVVRGRLPVVAGSELLWISTASGALAARHALTGLDQPAWSPTFAVPAGDVLVTGDGTTVLDPEGAVRWQAGDPGEVVGVAGDVVLTRTERRVTGRALATGGELWSRDVAPTGQVGARLVDGLLVTTRLGGHVTVHDPTTGAEVAALRVGPTPVAGPEWDGEATIVGATATDVFVRVDAPVGIRYARVRVATAQLVADLRELADADLREISEQVGALVTIGWDAVEVRRGGEVLWTAVELEHAPEGNRLVVSYGPFGTASGVGDHAPLRLDALAGEVGEARPGVLDGHAVVGTPLGVQALDLATGEPVWSRPLGTWGCCPSLLAGDGAVVLTGPVRVLDTDGERRWDDPAPDLSHGAPGAVAIADPWVVAVEHAGWGPGSARLLRLADGRRGPELAAGTLTGAVSDAGRLFAIDVASDRSPTLVAFDLPPASATGATVAPRWTRPATPGTRLVLTGDELLAVGAAAVDHLDPASGELLHRTALPALGSGPVAYADGRLVRRIDAATLEVVHLASGERWTRSFPAPLTSAPTIAGDLVYVADGRPAVSALELATGTAVVARDLDGPAVTSLTVAGGVVLAGGPDRLQALGPPAPPRAPRSAAR